MAANHTSVLSRGLRGLRKVKPALTDLAAEYSKAPDRAKPEGSSRSADARGGTSPGKLLRVWLKSPWVDYISAVPLSTSGASALAYRKGAYFNKAAIRAFHSHGSIRTLKQLSDIQHPNIAKIYDVFCHDDKLFTATEYLQISLTELDFQTFQFEEWEIATIVAEVRIFYLLQCVADGSRS
jgi:hypothetical protein